MKRELIFTFCCLLTTLVWSQEYQRTETGIKASIFGKKIDVEVQWFNANSLRVLKMPHGQSVDKKSLSVIARPEKTALKVSTSEDGNIVMKSCLLTVKLDTKTGVLIYETRNGMPLLKELENVKAFIPVNDAGRATYSVYQSFKTDKDEGLYGLGQLQNGQMMQRGIEKYLVQGNTEDVTPVFQSTKGYGVFWDNYAGTMYVDNEEETSFRSDVGDCIDYYFMYGGSADGVIAQIRLLTGSVPMMPLWSYGFMQSKERYKSQDEVVSVVKKYRELGIPLDCIIQDWQYWGSNYLWNAMEFLNYEYRDPKRMIDEVHGLNAHMMISIWSSFGPKTKPFKELEKEGLLMDMATWPESGVEGWPPNFDYPSGVKVYDPYHPKARDIYWNYLNKGIFQLGMDGWWMDSTEPDHFNVTEADLDTPTGMGSFRSVRGAFPLMTVGGVHDHQRQVSDSKRVFILTRSGWTGQQRYGCNVWSGDVSSTWEMLRNTVPALLNFTLTGNPNTNSDIGGFFCGAYNNGRNDNFATRNPQFQELYVRWLQMGAFTPMMRSHGTDIKREIYYFGKEGEPVYDAIRDAIRLRYRLLPYIYSTAWMVTDGDYSYMRALWMDFPADTATHNCHTQFMFGPALLAAPVLTAQYTPEKVMNLDANTGWNRTTTADGNTDFTVDFTAPRTYGVYLPAGTEWYDFHSGELLQGGNSVSASTTLGTMPLYVRAGAIIPVGPEVQYATEKPWNDLEIRVYPGADGRFTLYEDEGDNYNYENGAYSTIEFRWNDKSNRLTIGKRTGDFPGMLANRLFRVKNMATGRMTEVNYNGTSQTVRL